MYVIEVGGAGINGLWLGSVIHNCVNLVTEFAEAQRFETEADALFACLMIPADMDPTVVRLMKPEAN